MERRLSSASITTTEQKEPSLPVIKMMAAGKEINALYGYTTELDVFNTRECFTSLGPDKLVELHIYDRRSDVRKIMYELYVVSTGEKVLAGQISAFEYADDYKGVRMRLEYDFEYGEEYAVKLTAITSESQRVHYYFRLKQYDEAFFEEKIQFMLDFSEAARGKNKDYVIPYLESTYRGMGNNFSYVNLYDSYQMICWGELYPELISDISITIHEIYKYIMTGTLEYTVKLETTSGTEIYTIVEHFRVSLGKDYAYLLAYEREMESIFDNELTSVSQSEFKLGITSDTEVEMAYTKDNSMFCFVRNNSLFFYNLAENVLYEVYTVLENGVFPTDQNRDCNIKILRMDDSGNVSFMVSGYFTKGEYEGKTGIILYKYYRSDNRIEELLYVPITKTNEYIQQELGGFAYLSSTDFFYFLAYNRIYSYNHTTNRLTELTTAPISGKVIFCEELSYAAWQEQDDLQHIYLYYLEEGISDKITVSNTEVVQLFSSIGSNMIIGYGHYDDSASFSDGHRYYPISELSVIDQERNVLKNYSSEGNYIIDVEATDTSIKMIRVKKHEDAENVYVETDPDYIMIKNMAETKSFSTSIRATDLMLREYYLSIPNAYTMKERPKTEASSVTVVKESTTARLQELDSEEPKYQVFSFGHILAVSDSLGEAIESADTALAAGVVMDGKGNVVWERGVANRTGALSEGTKAEALASEDFNYYMHSAISVNGVDVAAAFYYIWQDIPVFAMPDDNTIILISEYTQTSVTYINTKTRRSYTVPVTRLRDMLASNGNIIWVVK